MEYCLPSTHKMQAFNTNNIITCCSIVTLMAGSGMESKVGKYVRSYIMYIRTYVACMFVQDGAASSLFIGGTPILSLTSF